MHVSAHHTSSRNGMRDHYEQSTLKYTDRKTMIHDRSIHLSSTGIDINDLDEASAVRRSEQFRSG
jgi:hypothetical protein